MKTLLLALISSGRSQSTREGAVRGLVSVGVEAIRKGLIECGGAKIIGSDCYRGEQSAVVQAVLVSDEYQLLYHLSNVSLSLGCP